MPAPITLVVYSESGGTYKTTQVANTGVALHRAGLDTLLIDLDAQEASLTGLFEGVGDNRSDETADNLVKHMLEMPDGDFSDIIETTVEGPDIIPSHDMLADFTRHLQNKQNAEVGLKYDSSEEFPRFEFLHRLLWQQEQIHQEYDAILIDPNARAEDLLYNAIYAMRTLIAPVKPAGKGSLSLEGLDGVVSNMEDELGIEVGLAAVTPMAITETNAHQKYTQQFLENDDYPTPVVIGDRESMMDDMWEARGSAFRVIEERWKTEDDVDKDAEPGGRRVRNRELETLEKIYALAVYLGETFDHQVDPELSLQFYDVEDGDLVAREETRTVDVRDRLPKLEEVVEA